ncbi:hypothetical protein [Marininema halotolerans]|uniref:Uncharacterized protein n=1 Tax=Marininema halotolerans TaxID=1155944 RepID=A0A1I6SZB4_9BACL|nr:hypothetical protein [Marininema halotolerans]SFS82242.1 hypothetical protein SAMN05444972_108147 [Marininema halotolerans]
MNKHSNTTENKLRRLIQRMVQEELDQRFKEGFSFDQKPSQQVQHPPPGRKERPAPPWAIFGSPQPDPDTASIKQPLQTNVSTEPPPYVPHQITNR